MNAKSPNQLRRSQHKVLFDTFSFKKKYEVSRFLKKNKTTRPNAFYAATKSLTDDDGAPVLWEIKPVSTKENNRIQEQCVTDVPAPGKPGQYRPRVNTARYAVKLVAASVVVPDLLNAELQDSYGVSTPEDLVQELVDDSAEWNALLQFVNDINGFVPLQTEIDTAKN